MMRQAVAALAIASALAFTSPLRAQANVDPARVAAAHRLMDAVMPPDQRAAMTQTIIKPMMDNVRATLAQDPTFTEGVGKDPRFKALFARFMDRVIRETTDGVAAGMPRMMDAMAIAYARQFTVEQLDVVRAFYQSDTGRAFAATVPKLMSDPAVLAAQREMMAAQLARMPAIMKDLQEEIVQLKAAK